MFVPPHKLTVGEWLNTRLIDYKMQEVRPKSYDTYELMAKRHIEPALGQIALQELRPEHVQHLYNEKLKQPKARGGGLIGPDTVKGMHQVLHGALRKAEKNRLVVPNVSALVILPPGKKA